MKLKLSILLSLIGLSLAIPNVSAQTTKGYTELINNALDAIDSSERIEQQIEALRIFDSAFRQYPDSIEAEGLYGASLTATLLGEGDKAFNYLNQLLIQGKDKYGFYGWYHIIYGESQDDFNNLKSDPRWRTLMAQVYSIRQSFMEQLKRSEEEFYATKPYSKEEWSALGDEDLYRLLRGDSEYVKKLEREYSLSFAVNDSTQTSFFVLLPQGYDPVKRYPLLFFLHGAVKHNSFSDFLTKEEVNLQCGRFIPDQAKQNDVILVFPKGNKQYNWMNPDDGFYMIPAMLRQIKRSINVDDNRVFVSGHSNGATGAFSYLMKQPSDFAGFYGFNTYPKVFTGGTFMENILNRSYVAITTDLDYYYPPNANDTLTYLMYQMGADYKEHRYMGFPHWFPQLDESQPAVELLFEGMKVKDRKPFRSQITWEFDDNKYGTIDWITEAKLDTIATKAKWHTDAANFDITEWLEYNKSDSLVSVPVDKKAFDFPRASGKLVGEYTDNTFRVKSSRVASFYVNISPEMVDMSKPVIIYWNDKLCYSGMISIDRDFMLHNFEENRDRSSLWVNRICIQ